MKRIPLILIFVLLSFGIGTSQTVTLRDTIFLSKATHLNYDLASWDSVFVKIVQGSVLISRIKLTEGDSGEYYGVYKPTYSGNFVVQYYAVYSGEIIREEQYFSVLDTNAFAGTVNCTGTGSNTVLVWILDSSDSTTGIPGFSVDVEDSITGANTPYGAYTNSAGLCILALDDGHYTIYLSAPRYSITSPRYQAITANTTLTYYATAMVVSPPPGDSACIVYGYVYNADGTPYNGARVEIGMNRSSVSFHGALINLGPFVTYTDTLGYFEFSTATYMGKARSTINGVYPNDLLLPANTLWYLKVTTDHLILTNTYEIPIGDSYEIDFTLP